MQQRGVPSFTSHEYSHTVHALIYLSLQALFQLGLRLCSSCQAVSNSLSLKAISVEKKSDCNYVTKHVTKYFCVEKERMADKCCNTHAVFSRFIKFILCDNCATVIVDIATTCVSFKVLLSQEDTIESTTPLPHGSKREMEDNRKCNSSCTIVRGCMKGAVTVHKSHVQKRNL